MCGLLSAINALADPFDILIEPADKLLACKGEVFPNNWESYELQLQFGGCACKEVRDGRSWKGEACQDDGLGGLRGVIARMRYS